MGFTLRRDKGEELTHDEVDDNFAQGVGLQTEDNLYLHSPDVRPFGGGQIIVTNGSDQVTGVDTLFQNEDGNSVSNTNAFVFVDSAGTLWLAMSYSIASDTALTVSAFYDITNDATTELAGDFAGVSGTYDYYTSLYVPAPGEHGNISIGEFIYATKSYGAGGNIGIGRNLLSGEENNIMIGNLLRALGSGNVILGRDSTAEGSSSALIGRYNINKSEGGFIVGQHHTILASNDGCGIISEQGVQLDSTNMSNCLFVGFKDEQVGYANLQNTLVANNLLIASPATFPRNREALEGLAHWGTLYLDEQGKVRAVRGSVAQNRKDVYELESNVYSDPTMCNDNQKSSATLTGGSDTVSGTDTNFLNTSPTGISTTGGFYFRTQFFSNLQEWYVEVTPVSATVATITQHYDLTTDPLKQNPLGANWTGPTQTREIFPYKTLILQPSLGVFTNIRNVVLGLKNLLKSVGANILGFGNTSTSNNTDIIGRNNRIGAGANGSAIFGGADNEVSGVQNVTVVGMTGFQTTDNAYADTFVTNKLNIDSIPEYANDAAADAVEPLGGTYTLTGSRIVYIRK